MRHTNGRSKQADGGTVGGGNQSRGGGGRTRRLAIFRVHSVAKPQLTALLGSYSSSRPLASSLPYLLLLFRSPFPSRSSSLPFLFITIPSASSTVRPPLVLLRLYDLPSLLLHALLYCITHVLSLFFPPHFSFVFFYVFFFSTGCIASCSFPFSLLVPFRLRLLQWVSVNKRIFFMLMNPITI